MSANLKCYDPATGRVLFDLSGHTTRLLGVVGTGTTSGEVKVETGGGTLFWTLVGGGAWLHTQTNNTSNGIIWLSNPETNNQITINIVDNTITYQKPSHVIFVYGVYI